MHMLLIRPCAVTARDKHSIHNSTGARSGATTAEAADAKRAMLKDRHIGASREEHTSLAALHQLPD